MKNPSEINEKLHADDEAGRYLEFTLGENSFAIPLANVKEVIPPPEHVPLPTGPKYFVGIMNLRGQIVTVMDLGLRLGVKPGLESENQTVIIVDYQDLNIGVRIDETTRVLKIPENEKISSPEITGQFSGKFANGIYQLDEQLTVLLDVEKVLGCPPLASAA